MCKWGGGGRGLFYVVVLMLFFEFRVKHQEFGKIFSFTTFLTQIFSYSILKVNLCTSRRTQLQLDVLRRCQHFCSHDATCPGHLG